MEDIGNSWKKEQSIQDVLETRKEEHDFLNNHNDEVRESYTVLMIVSSGQLVVSGQFDEHHQIVSWIIAKIYNKYPLEHSHPN